MLRLSTAGVRLLLTNRPVNYIENIMHDAPRGDCAMQDAPGSSLEK
jgi:hypothetical protein